MRVLILGSGAREHALAWKIKQSVLLEKLFTMPGNPGTASIGENISIDILDHPEVINFAKEKNIDLVVVGPDQPLADGITDQLSKAGIRVFGPSREAARLEWSKSFAKKFMKEEGIPTADYAEFSDLSEAKDYLLAKRFPIVLKADGLALGKGVVIVENMEEAYSVLHNFMSKKALGKAGTKVIIEEFLEGVEISIHAISDGVNFIMFPPSADHKRVYDNDRGPNTGGMGAMAPVSIPEPILENIKKYILEPAIYGMAKRGIPFAGLLYPGIILTTEGPKVVEFNARFGDPETQVYMRLLQSDLLEIFNACVDGKLKSMDLRWSSGAAATVTLASGGYPGDYTQGLPIGGVFEAGKIEGVVVFHAGTKESGGLFTNGGRVLSVSAIGRDLREAAGTAYEAVGKINFQGMQYRKDIGNKFMSRIS
ncbi:MAG: phosphoribosylamine--glycine ligase [Patescibacteria group bacterium]